MLTFFFSFDVYFCLPCMSVACVLCCIYSENDLDDDLYDYVPHGTNGGGGEDEIYDDLMSARKRRSRISSVNNWLNSPQCACPWFYTISSVACILLFLNALFALLHTVRLIWHKCQRACAIMNGPSYVMLSSLVHCNWRHL